MTNESRHTAVYLCACMYVCACANVCLGGERKRGSVCMCNCAHEGRRQRGQEGDREAERWKGKERVSVCNLLLRSGNGRFASSTPISLLWHSSPLNRIDYWFCSLCRLWDFPSGSLCSKRSAEEKHKSLCVLPHNDTSRTVHKWGRFHERNLVIATIYLSGGWGLSWC